MFESIVGQESAKNKLCSMIESGRLSQTLLFVGPYGVGKSETALEMARMLLCENGINSGCTSCGSCGRASAIEHPDLYVMFPFKARPMKSENYSSWLESFLEHKKILANELYAPVVYERGRQIVKELVSDVQEKLQESSFEGGAKVCIILSADRLNDKTANSLLKVLEEPPEEVYLILTSERLTSILPTIVSRASIIKFRRLKVEEIEEYFEKNNIAESAKRSLYAKAGDGSIKTAKAFALTDKADIRSRSIELFEAVAKGESEVILSALPFLRSRNYLEAEEIITGFALIVKSVLEKKVGFDTNINELSDTVEVLSGSTDIPSLHRLSARLEEGLEMLGRNVNISMVLTTIFYGINDVFGKKQYS